MKDKLEPNMYVRTKWGYICKIININDYREPSMKYGVEASYLKDVMFIGDEDILKASYNITDLISRFDLVNGYLVICKMYEDEKDKPTIIKCVGDYYFKEEDIKSVITHEQMEQMAYHIRWWSKDE